MGESFPSHFTNEHEMLFYEASYHGKNGKDKSSLVMKNQDNISSPEFNLFHMASPELERLLVGQASTSQTSTTNSRETTTINSSDLNVLNLGSPDFDKIFSNFHAGFGKESDQRGDLNKATSVEHQVYTNTFVDALHKSLGIAHQEDNRNGNSDIRQHGNKMFNFDQQKDSHQFPRRKSKSDHHFGKNEQNFSQNEHHFSKNEQHFSKNGQHFLSGLQSRENNNKIQANYGTFRQQFSTVEDRNRNKIGVIEQRGGKDGKRSNYGNQILNPSMLDNHFYARDKTGQINLIEDGNRNTIQACYGNPTNPSEVILNSDHPTNPILDNHPELFKLHAHVKLSENLRDHMGEVPTGDQEDHTCPQMFPLPPIDLQVQEIVKRERKKQKNRVAASKCRKKKLEREAQLEVSVQHLRERNEELSAVATALRGQVTDLKQRVMEHYACGCHVTAVTIAY